MNPTDSQLVQGLLAGPGIHRKWEAAYRTPENEKFYDHAFDYIVRVINPPLNAMILDVGCGICAHSVRLVKHGFIVHGIDCSETILREAKLNVKSKGLESKIGIHCADILSLPFRDETFNYVLCWGVLMHIPDLEKAMGEISRVLTPGGMLIVSETNMYSLQSRIFRNLRRFLKKERADPRATPAGLEHWSSTPDGKLVTRETNVTWLIDAFKRNGLRVTTRVSGQFTEAYTRVSIRPIKHVIHAFNKLWFRYVRIPYPAFGNIVILEKFGSSSLAYALNSSKRSCDRLPTMPVSERE